MAIQAVSAEEAGEGGIGRRGGGEGGGRDEGKEREATGGPEAAAVERPMLRRFITNPPNHRSVVELNGANNLRVDYRTTEVGMSCTPLLKIGEPKDINRYPLVSICRCPWHSF